jgi:hypothetical protein
MKFTRKALALSIMAVTASMSAHAIKVDSDSRGQLLMAPVFAAGVGQSTEIRVVNPSTEIAVKAHVTIRSKENTLDLLNFVIYLTPGDEWIGTLKNVDGKPVLVSEDDSQLHGYTDAAGVQSTTTTPANGVFPSIGNPVTIPLFKDNYGDAQPFLDTRTIGHIEVIGVYAVYNDVIAAGANDTNDNFIAAGMSKEILFDIDNIVYNAANSQTFKVDGLEKGGMYDGYLPVYNPIADNFNGAGRGAVACVSTNGLPFYVELPTNLDVDQVKTTTTVIDADDYCLDTSDDRIQLFGEIVIKLSENGAPMSYNMVALDDSAVPGDVAIAGVLDGDVFDMMDRHGVINNPLYDIVLENDVAVGVRFDAPVDLDVIAGAPSTFNANSGQATDNIDDIDAALATATFTGTYDSMQPLGANTNTTPTGSGESMIVMTFPTKYRHLPANSPDYSSLTDMGNAAKFKGLDQGVDPLSATLTGSTLIYGSTAGTSLTTSTLFAAKIDEVNDNSATNRNTSDDYDNNPHYDYDYGFRQGIYDALQLFNDGNAQLYLNHYAKTAATTGSAVAGTSPGHAFTYSAATGGITAYAASGTDTFIFGTRDDSCNGTAQVKYDLVSYDTEERKYSAPVISSSSVYSGGRGTGATTEVAGTPDEVNLVTDDRSGANSLWYSTKGWYNLSYTSGLCPTLAQPSIVMTVTTDTNGNSRIVPAARTN